MPNSSRFILARAFSKAIKDSARQLYFVVVLPDGKVVEPRIAKTVVTC